MKIINEIQNTRPSLIKDPLLKIRLLDPLKCLDGKYKTRLVIERVRYIFKYACGVQYWKILKCLLFLCILGFLNAWWPFEIRMWSSFRFICPVEKIRGRESIHNCEKHWKSICIFVLKTLAGRRERERDTLEVLFCGRRKKIIMRSCTLSHCGLFWPKKLQNKWKFQAKCW